MLLCDHFRIFFLALACAQTCICGNGTTQKSQKWVIFPFPLLHVAYSLSPTHTFSTFLPFYGSLRNKKHITLSRAQNEVRVLNRISLAESVCERSFFQFRGNKKYGSSPPNMQPRGNTPNYIAVCSQSLKDGRTGGRIDGWPCPVPVLDVYTVMNPRGPRPQTSSDKKMSVSKIQRKNIGCDWATNG